MANLRTSYMGLELKSPVIAGSSGLTNSIEDIIEIEKNGAGAVVLKSLFEEEINLEMEKNLMDMNRPSNIYPEIFDFFDITDVEDTVSKYLSLISDAKKSVSIPVIASINCISASEWVKFARQIEEAGADGLELNIFVMPSDFSRSSADNEKIYFDIIEKVKQEVKIPIAIKVSYFFSNLASFLKNLSSTGVSSIVLFNRFFAPDFDLERLTVEAASLYSSPSDLPLSLRWISILGGRVDCDLAASTGVHDGKSVIKQILAGANAVQVVSALYKNGFEHISTMNNEISMWMDKKGFKSIDEFRGRLSQATSLNPAVYERTQFMHHYSKKF